MTGPRTVGIVALPDLAAVLRDAGFDVVGGADFHDAATPIKVRLDAGDKFPILASAVRTAGVQAWLTRQSMRTTVVLVGVDGAELAIPNVVTVGLPAAVDDVVCTADLDPLGGEAGAAEVALDGTIGGVAVHPPVTEGAPPVIAPAPTASTARVPAPTAHRPPASAPAPGPAEPVVAAMPIADDPWPDPTPGVATALDAWPPDDVVADGQFDEPGPTVDLEPRPAPALPPPTSAFDTADADAWPPDDAPAPAPMAYEPPAPPVAAPVASPPPVAPAYEAPAPAPVPAPAPAAMVPVAVREPEPADWTEEPDPTQDHLLDLIEAGAVATEAASSPSTRRPGFHEAAPVVYSVSGKGGVGKTTMAAILAQRAAERGEMRVILVDANRGQADLTTYLRLGRSGLPTIFDAARTHDPMRAIVSRDQVNEARHARLDKLGFSVVLGPPASKADPAIVTPDVYRRVIDQARKLADLVIVDTQIVESYDTSGLFDQLVTPSLVSGGWAFATSDLSSASVTNISARLKIWREQGVPKDRMLMVLNRVDGSIALDEEAMRSAFSNETTLIGAIENSTAMVTELNQGIVRVGAPELQRVLDQVLFRVTGDPVFNQPIPDGIVANFGDTLRRLVRRRKG